MALIDQLLGASFRGVPFLVSTSSITGGRKTIPFEYSNSDRRYVEDLGLLNKAFSVSGIITGEGYFHKRDSLIAALEKSGIGKLIHPFYGIQNVVLTGPYTVTENMTSIGEAVFTMTFSIAQDPIFPKASPSTFSTIFNSVSQTIEIVKTAIIQAIAITTSNNFLDALSKTSTLVGTIGILSTQVPFNSTNSDEFSKNLLSTSANTSLLLSDTISLSDSIASLFTSLDDAISTPSGATATFTKMFTFGDSDIRLTRVVTAELNERYANSGRLNAAAQLLALLMVYRNTPQMSFNTVDDINAHRQILDDQFEKVSTFESVSRMNKTTLFQTRVLVSQFLDNLELSAFKIGEFDVKPTTITELTYRLYGSTDNRQALIDLNQFTDIRRISGVIKVLTK